MDKQKLIDLGLTDGESKVYIVLLKLGSSKVGPIVKNANVAYSNIYSVLNRLIEKGLVSFIIKEKTRYFQAVNPSKLYEYLEKKEEKIKQEKEVLNKVILELQKINKIKSNESAEVFLGIKGIKTAFERLFEDSRPKEEYLFFYVSQKEYDEMADKIFLKMYQKFKNLNTKGIATENYKDSRFVKKTKIKIKFVSFPTPGNIDILKDKLMLTSWQETPISILITSKDIAKKFRDYFYTIWNENLK